MEHLGSYRMDFHDIWYFTIFQKYVKKIQASLKSQKNNAYFTWRPMYFQKLPNIEAFSLDMYHSFSNSMYLCYSNSMYLCYNK